MIYERWKSTPAYIIENNWYCSLSQSKNRLVKSLKDHFEDIHVTHDVSSPLPKWSWPLGQQYMGYNWFYCLYTWSLWFHLFIINLLLARSRRRSSVSDMASPPPDASAFCITRKWLTKVRTLARVREITSPFRANLLL